MHLITTAPAGLNVDEINAFHLMVAGWSMRAGVTADAPIELAHALEFAQTHDMGQLFGTAEAWAGISAYVSEFYVELTGVDVFVGHMGGSHF